MKKTVTIELLSGGTETISEDCYYTIVIHERLRAIVEQFEDWKVERTMNKIQTREEGDAREHCWKLEQKEKKAR